MKNDSLLNHEFNRERFSQANQDVWDTLSKIKGEPFIKYRKLIKQAEAGNLLTDFPVEILIKTTMNCNHFCPRCPHGMGIFPKGKEYDMSMDVLKKVIDEGAEKGLQSVVFTGGEPTLHPHFIDFLNYVGSKNFPDVSIITNGSLLSDKLITSIIENGVTRINISFDSITPETYKTVRGVDDYAKVINNIERLLEIRSKLKSKTPLLSLSFVLSEDNANELDGFVEMWEKKADGGLKIYPYKDVYSIIDDEYMDTYGMGTGKRKPSELKTESLPKKLSHDNQIMADYEIKCTIPWYRCHVGVHGELQACTTIGFCDHPLMMMGNINEISFEEAWKSESWSNLRKITLSGQYEQHPVCRKCRASI